MQQMAHQYTGGQQAAMLIDMPVMLAGLQATRR